MVYSTGDRQGRFHPHFQPVEPALPPVLTAYFSMRLVYIISYVNIHNLSVYLQEVFSRIFDLLSQRFREYFEDVKPSTTAGRQR